MLDSISQSTVLPIEVLVVNDGSTEPETIRLLGEMNREGVRVITQENRGLSAARNTGFREAIGTFIVPLDADDAIAPQFLEQMLLALTNHPNTAFAYTDARLFGDETGVWETMEYNLYQLLWENALPACAMIRRASWATVGGYDEKMREGYEDWEFWIRLGLHKHYGVRIPQPLFLHRRTRGSMTDTARQRRQAIVASIREKHARVYKNRSELARLAKEWDGQHTLFFLTLRIKNMLRRPELDWMRRRLRWFRYRFTTK